MVEVLLSVVVVAVAVTVGLAALLAVTVAPLVVALARGEQVGASPARVGTAAVAGALVALLVAEALRRGGAGAASAVALLLAWVVPVVVARAPRESRWLGRAGQHTR
ncbi:MAG TPA: hypothetical protein VNU66_01885 [Mycobacteriales bacterium]|nr:hypothetical protein [Mycobacteriales bacterium]